MSDQGRARPRTVRRIRQWASFWLDRVARRVAGEDGLDAAKDPPPVQEGGGEPEPRTPPVEQPPIDGPPIEAPPEPEVAPEPQVEVAPEVPGTAPPPVESAPPPGEPVAPRPTPRPAPSPGPGEGPPEHWVALVKRRAPELLRPGQPRRPPPWAVPGVALPAPGAGPAEPSLAQRSAPPPALPSLAAGPGEPPGAAWATSRRDHPLGGMEPRPPPSSPPAAPSWPAGQARRPLPELSLAPASPPQAAPQPWAAPAARAPQAEQPLGRGDHPDITHRALSSAGSAPRITRDVQPSPGATPPPGPPAVDQAWSYPLAEGSAEPARADYPWRSPPLAEGPYYPAAESVSSPPPPAYAASPASWAPLEAEPRAGGEGTLVGQAPPLALPERRWASLAERPGMKIGRDPPPPPLPAGEAVGPRGGLDPWPSLSGRQPAGARLAQESWSREQRRRERAREEQRGERWSGWLS